MDKFGDGQYPEREQGHAKPLQEGGGGCGQWVLVSLSASLPAGP